MSKRPGGLNAAFVLGEQPVLNPESKPQAVAQPQATPKPKRDPRANRKAFTVWLDEDLIARIRNLSRDLVAEHGRPGNSIEALVTEAIEHVIKTRGGKP